MNRLGWHSLGTEFACPCGEVHRLPIEACHIGTDAAARMAAFAKDRCGRKGVVIADPNTRGAAGDAPVAALRKAGKHIEEILFGRADLDATQEEGDALVRRTENAEFYVAVGSGTLSDLAKYAGDLTGRPVLLYPTAASMNGYTSAIVALKVRGLKRTLPCRPALGIFADPEVAATAPRAMTAAGVGDFLSKCSSSTDWRAAHLLRGGYFCERPREFFDGTQDRVLTAASGVVRSDPDAVGAVLEALLLSGLSMVVAGSSAPASGGEHLISHYLDMKSALDGTANDLHGAQVGVATVYCLELWERVLALDPVTLDTEQLLRRQPDDVTIREAIAEDWGTDVGAEVQAQWDQKRIAPDEFRTEIRRFQDILRDRRAELARDLLPAATVAGAIRAAGGPVQPEEMRASPLEYGNAIKRARFLRNRFTILDLAAELGIVP